ncbi:hypothetical protein [Hydrogenophaga sp.]
MGQSAAAVACLLWLWVPTSTATSIALAVAVLLGVPERWYAVRMRLDAELFRAMSRGDIASLTALDGALLALRLRKSTGKTRTLQSRIDGTHGLVRRHTGLVIAQAGCLLTAWISHSS